MPDHPSFVLRVCVPIIAPIVARAGQLLVVTPGHPTHTVVVVTPDARRVVRHRFVPDGALYGPLLCLDADGVVTCVTSRATARRAFAS